MLKLWVKTLARTFFAQHAGLFLFVFYLIFGAVEPSQMLSYNLALLLAISSSGIATLIFCLILLLYGLKCLAFIKLRLTLPAYNFVKASAAATQDKQQKTWLKLYLVLFSPLLVYIFLVIATGIHYHYFGTAAGLLTWCAMLFAILVKLSYKHINYAYLKSAGLSRINLPVFKKPGWTWRLNYLIRRQTIMLLCCKILSLLLFKGIIWMFGPTDDDTKVYMIALLATIMTHCVLITTVLKFENTQLAFARSLPVSPLKKLLQLLFFFLILFLPELLIYTLTIHFAPAGIVAGLFFCTAGLLIFFYSPYLLGENTDSYLKFVFAFFIAMMLVILYNVVLIFSILIIVILTSYHYYLYYKCRL